MQALLSQIDFWHWLAFGLVLLLVELIGAAGYLLWLGLAALLTGLIMLIAPELAWQLQWVTFAVLSLLSTILWWRYQHNKDKEDDSGRSLNQKMMQLVGRRFRLEEDIDQRGRVKLGDTTWSVYCAEPIAASTLVEVIAVDGIVLEIKPVEV
ncbi:Inner membrane protein YbbJ [Vibrio stylophorae]|uniref:Inner membrane protein YbbJ n=1 Tax=Vibrio stylophorae TaxID=659351 RepID=A0ABN8DWA2_9VIBR|nr:NfeD family protein [Vibrio stylophorae]CAH0534148.1 Inner membrane protein YbbJ [Vibrio stylophorae]